MLGNKKSRIQCNTRNIIIQELLASLRLYNKDTDVVELSEIKIFKI